MIEFLEPSCNVPSRYRVKHSGLTEMKSIIENKIIKELKTFDSINISLDGWSDRTMRCFNGYIAQGIDNEWSIKTIVIAFEYVIGRHTAVNIKKQFDEGVERYNIQDKIYKVIADQAANMKKALSDVNESTEIIGGANEENIINITKMLIERRRVLDTIQNEKDRIEAQNLNLEIENLNNEFLNSASKNSKYLNRDQVILFDLNNDELTESLSSCSDDEKDLDK